MSLDNQAMEKCLLRTPFSTDSTSDDTAGSRFSSLCAYLHQFYPHSTFLPLQKWSERPFLHGPPLCSMHLIPTLNQHAVHFPNPTHSFMQIFSNPCSAAMEQLFSLLPEGAEHVGNTCCSSGYSLLDPRIRLAPVPLGIYILPGYCLGEDFWA